MPQIVILSKILLTECPELLDIDRYLMTIKCDFVCFIVEL